MFFCSLLRFSSVFYSSIMPPRPSKRRNRPVSLDPKSLTLAELDALPRNSLILLASARNLVTTGTKSRLAQRVYEHERANGYQTQATGPRRPAPTMSNVNPEVSTDADRPLSSPGLQQLSSGSQFLHDQLSQLREIIAEVIGPQRTDSDQALGLPTDVPPLSPACGLNSVLNNTSGQIAKSLPHVLQDGGRSQHQPVPSLPSAPQGSAPLMHLGAQNDLTLPPLPEKLRSKIAKREYIDFNDLLSDNMYPHPSFASSQNNSTLTVDPQDATTLAFVPSQRKKRRMDGLSSWLKAWNVFLRSTLSLYPQLTPDLLAYQDEVCKFSRKFKASAWLMYDTAFRYMAASNTTMAWAKVNEQLYNDILKEETLPYCINCHVYGHRWLAP